MGKGSVTLGTLYHSQCFVHISPGGRGFLCDPVGSRTPQPSDPSKRLTLRSVSIMALSMVSQVGAQIAVLDKAEWA